MLDVITDHLDIWTTAQKQKKAVGRGSAKKEQGYGIKKLRELILELAVRGKLVPQDPKDEPASVLLEKIAEEKQRLIDEGKIKKTRKLPDISEKDMQFQLPHGWEWTQFASYYDVRDGTHDSPKAQLTGFPLVTSKNLYTGTLDLSNVTYITEEDHLKINQRSKVDRGDILFAMIGSIGNPVIVNIDDEFSIKNVALFKYYLEELSVPRYLQVFLILAAVKMKEEASGGVQSFVSLGKLRAYVMAVPPLAEQHRIVAKVDELMALCDQLEQEQADHQATHQTLVKTLLNGLIETATHRPIDPSTSSELTAQDEQASTQHPVRPESTKAKPPEAQTTADYFNQLIAQHFDTLFTTEDSIDQLKQTILQLAVMGKLVPQNPQDEPASVLLEKITKEKAKLIKEGKIKKQKALPEITEDEKPFGLPEGWEWVRLWQIVFLLGDGLHGTPEYTPDGKYYFVNGNNLQEGKIIIKPETKTVGHEQFLKYKKNLGGNTVLVSINGTLGNIAFYDNENIVLGKSACYFNLSEEIYKSYIKVIIKSPAFLNYAFKNATGSIIKNLGLKAMNNLPLALPPLAEQHRIVTKVNQLLSLCDTLKANLNQAQTTQTQLADTIVKQAVN